MVRTAFRRFGQYLNHHFPAARRARGMLALRGRAGVFRNPVSAALTAICLGASPGLAVMDATAVPVALPPTGAVDVALVLAVDVSSSVNADERRFQRVAYARALSDPLVARAALGGRHGRIALGFMEWSGPRYQNVIIPVHVIDSPEGLLAFADRIAALAEAEERMDSAAYLYFSGTTAMGSALLRAADALRALDVPAESVVIDLSADGINNDGAMIDTVRDQLVAEGVTINGLPIAVGAPAHSAGVSFDSPEAELEAFFADCVVGGPGAFQILARGWQDVEQALRAKLVLELAGFAPDRRRRLAQALGHPAQPGLRIIPAQFTLDLGQQGRPARQTVDCARGRLRPPMMP